MAKHSKVISKGAEYKCFFFFVVVILDYLDAWYPTLSHIIPHKRSLCPRSGESGSGHPSCTSDIISGLGASIPFFFVIVSFNWLVIGYC